MNAVAVDAVTAVAQTNAAHAQQSFVESHAARVVNAAHST